MTTLVTLAATDLELVACAGTCATVAIEDEASELGWAQDAEGDWTCENCRTSSVTGRPW
ncbi:hypothetical protein [Streptomyces sp. N35]|uniref:hypothetical protein n=1 Tax=Streptomyces sp. N35 TaxID=2795730 RepID=UPI0018F481C1|nr:hypothetical protein [Streptomyces sp. N35]